MASTAKILSSFQAPQAAPSPRAVAAPPARPSWGWLQLLRESLGGALLLVAWIALWTVTWAAIAGPLSPVRETGRAQVSSVERA